MHNTLYLGTRASSNTSSYTWDVTKPEPNPIDYGATPVVCVWCGHKDRIEFLKMTEHYTTQNQSFFFECRDEEQCELRVAKSGWDE